MPEDLVEEMKKDGQIIILGHEDCTSGRRWMSKGLIRTAPKPDKMALYKLGFRLWQRLINHSQNALPEAGFSWTSSASHTLRPRFMISGAGHAKMSR